MAPGGCGGRCIDNNWKMATDDGKCCYYICDECFCKTNRIRRWGKTGGWKEKGGWGLGEERAAGGGSKGRELGKREKRRELINI